MVTARSSVRSGQVLEVPSPSAVEQGRLAPRLRSGAKICQARSSDFNKLFTVSREALHNVALLESGKLSPPDDP